VPDPSVLSRTLTIIAVAFLTFDGAALAVLGVVIRRPMFVAMGSVFFVSAVIVLMYWRWYRRTLEGIQSERRLLADEARQMRNDVAT
jgi:membrane protein implicated in regulation of membrane protease activity